MSDVRAPSLKLAVGAAKFVLVQDSLDNSPTRLSTGLLEAQLGSNTGPSYATRAALFADLGWDANTVGYVYGDSTTAFNGVYVKAGATGAGSWSKIGDLPLPDLVLINDSLNRIEFIYQFLDTTTGAAPPNGQLKFNNASASLVTQILIDYEDRDGADRQTAIAAWQRFTTGTIQGRLKLTHAPAPERWAEYEVTSVTDSTGFFTLGVTYIASANMPFVNGVSVATRFRLSADRDIAAEAARAIAIELAQRPIPVLSTFGGTSTAMTAVDPTAAGAYFNGQSWWATFAQTNGAAATLNVSTYGAFALTDEKLTALPASFIDITQRYLLRVSISGSKIMLLGAAESLARAAADADLVTADTNAFMRMNQTTGSSTAYVATSVPAVGIANAQLVRIRLHVDCGANPTYNPDGAGALSLKTEVGGAISAGDIKQGREYFAFRAGTELRVIIADVISLRVADASLAAAEADETAARIASDNDILATITAGPIFKNTWNATTNTPTIPAAAGGNLNWFYEVTTAGTTTIDGQNVWNVGDRLISNGALWRRIPKTDAVRYFEDYGVGVGLGDAAVDTAAFLTAVALGFEISGKPDTPFYYINHGVLPGSGAFIKDVRIKVKLGSGGFASKDFSAATRYDQNHCLFNWATKEGGGFRGEVEIYGDGGGDYVCCPVAINNGMAAKTFTSSGRVYIHDMSLVSGGFNINNVGLYAYDINTIEFRNVGTAQPADYWVLDSTGLPSGSSTYFPNPTGVALDDSGTSKRGRIRQVIGYEGRLRDAAYATHGQQSDLVTLANADGQQTNDKGPHIDLIQGEFFGDICDLFGRGSNINRIEGRNCTTVLKMPHGARYNRIGHVNGVGVGISLVNFSGTNIAGQGPTEYNVVQLVTGDYVGYLSLFSGTLVSATNVTNGKCILPSPAKAIDSYYSKTAGAIRITGGTGAGQEKIITAYNGTTKELTVSGLWSPAPDNTSTFDILERQAANRTAIEFATGTEASPENNTVLAVAVRDRGYMNQLVTVYGLTDNNAGNYVGITRDFGFVDRPITMGSGAVVGAVRVEPVGAQGSISSLNLDADHVIATTTETVLNFKARYQDTYRSNAGLHLQTNDAATNKGILKILPGPIVGVLRIRVKVAVNGTVVTIRIYQGATVIASQFFTMVGTGIQDIPATPFEYYHNEDQFGTGDNIYTVSVQHSAGTSVTYDANVNGTRLSISC